MNVFFFLCLITAPTNLQQSENQWTLALPSADKQVISCQPWLFQFNTFREGLVVFRNNSTRKVLMNYNFLHGKLQFIDEHADTLLLTHKYLVKRVTIANQEFIPGVNDADDDLEIIKAYPTIKLARLTKLMPKPSLSQQFKTDPSSAIPSSLFISNSAGEFQWQNTVLPMSGQLKTTYYFVDDNSLIYPASLKNIHKLYKKQLAAVRTYSKTHKVNFTNVDHIVSFLNYLDEQNQ